VSAETPPVETATDDEHSPAPMPDGIRGLLGIAEFRGVAFTMMFAAMTLGGGRFVFIWLIGELTDWDTAIAILGIVIGLPPLMLSAWAGSLADRLDPNRLGLTLLLGGTALFAATAVIVNTGEITIPLAMICAFLTAIAPAMLMPLLQALVPSVVPRERLMPAVAIQNLAMMVSMITGTFVCGAVIQGFGIGAGFWFLAIATGLGTTIFLMVELPHRLTGAAKGDRVTVGEGIRRALSLEPLRSLLILTFIMGMAAGTSILLLPEIARDVLGQDSLAAGALTGFLSLGMMITTLILASRWTPARPGRVLAITMCGGLGTGLILIGLSNVYFWTAVISFAWGAGGGISMTLLRTLTQLNTPAELMGRVMGLATMAMNGAAPVSALLLVGLVSFTSIGTAMVISGCVYTACVWIVVIVSPVRHAGSPDAPVDQSP